MLISPLGGEFGALPLGSSVSGASDSKSLGLSSSISKMGLMVRILCHLTGANEIMEAKTLCKTVTKAVVTIIGLLFYARQDAISFNPHKKSKAGTTVICNL